MKFFFILTISALVVSGCAAVNAPSEDIFQDNGENPIVVNDSSKTSGYSIRLTSPQQNQILKSPFLVGGEANLPNDAVYVRVKKTNQDIVISEQTKAKQGAFGVLLNFVFQSTDKGIVEVYGLDDSGKEIALKSIDVSFDTASEGLTPSQ